MSHPFGGTTTVPTRCYSGAMNDKPVSLNLRLPQELHKRLKARADEQRRSLNSEIVLLLDEATSGKQYDRT
ncbi:Arc family DNA-binding protein [Saccharopolyspora spinosa]|uniref:Arc-like DNA binding dprotein n=1 Tax=Saccharopolyspora spinosa TaxID=60894 RepID=A0A2N3XSK0_SACSN|nr:Arc family DNA-binding protein [Saccharopolyspora spinosa]PKW13654.1 Arc-like DNA binding dprotein [Saccharopolyspora spinosa]